ncbi:hypothetical protein CPHO_07000 [Corynebacterium phocae]|uniref:Uncharacterized protein n=1 Tax=Corynebacterium phocae TaxID=161895 RepID=A0A1L7D423_9CORY|nr:hypothetical protein [Corynebacterium phocae]APT92682.1 hypothetical protein CPHO_07000 [Corynebacterium phocae]KAA8723571.1 hypothetical protein F4V58_06515 [Corynebacterium phocae]
MEPATILETFVDPKSPAGFISYLLLFVVAISGALSNAAAKYAGLLGGAARALQRHKERAREADEQSNARRIARLEENYSRVESELDSLREKDRRSHDYSLYVAEYWRALEFWAIEEGIKLKPPPMLTYPEWERKQYPAG